MDKKTISRQKRAVGGRVKRRDVSAYQVHVKGPERNMALGKLLASLKDKVQGGGIILKKDKYGNVLRVIETKVTQTHGQSVLAFRVARYNEKRTGLAWDIPHESLVEELDKVTAQASYVMVFPEPHIAFLEHKTHGPTPKQVEEFLTTLLENQAKELNIDCEVQIIPTRRSAEIEKIKKWSRIKRFQIELIRPNPSGTVSSRRLREILDETSADKLLLGLSSNEAHGLRPEEANLIETGMAVVAEGMGHVSATGIDADGSSKVGVDSRQIVVEKFAVAESPEKQIPLWTLIFEQLARLIHKAAGKNG